MNLYKSIFHKLVEPLNGFEAQHILAAGNLLKHNIGDDKKIAYAIGEVVMRIGRLRQFVAENILSDDFEERAAQLLDADGTSVADKSTSNKDENDRPKACTWNHQYLKRTSPGLETCPRCGERLSS